jgi:hypothetical protein
MASLEEENESTTSSSSNRRPLNFLHLIRETRPDEPIRGNKGRIFYCGITDYDYSSDIQSNFRRHLSTRHKISLPTNTSKVIEHSEQDLQRIFASLTLEDRKEFETTVFAEYMENHPYRAALVYMIVENRLSFSLVESPSFHTFLLTMNPEASRLIPRSHNTIKQDILSEWLLKKEEIKKELREARSYLNISLDVWTSPNRILYLGIVGHYVRKNGNYTQTRLLGMKQIFRHSAIDQWNTLQPLLEEYDQLDSLGFIIGDNATTNDKLCRVISTWMIKERGIDWNAEHSRIRCLGHMINLIVQAFLLNSNNEKRISQKDFEAIEEFEQNLLEEECVIPEAEQEAIHKDHREKFRSLGAIGKLHNIVVFIRSSGVQTAQWLDRGKRMIPLDNRTRWNSWYQMISVACTKEESLDLYIKRQPELTKDQLSAEDWKWLHRFRKFLGKFESYTLQNEGHDRDIGRSLTTMICIGYDIKNEKQDLEKKPRKV